MAWGHEIDPADPGRTRRRPARAATARSARRSSRCAARVSCPVMVRPRHRRPDARPPIGERLAELTGGSWSLVEGAGHGPPPRDPVLVNHEIAAFAERFAPAGSRRAATRGAARPHAAARGRSTCPRRSASATPGATSRSPTSCAAAPRPARSTGSPRTRSRGCSRTRRARPPGVARTWPASPRTSRTSAGEHDLHAFQAIRRMDEILVNNFMVFDDVVERRALRPRRSATRRGTSTTSCTRTPSSSGSPFAWMTDFVGWLPMPDGGARGGGADRRLQRRDDRAARPLRRAARPVDLRRQPRRRRARRLRPRPAARSATGPSENFDFAGYVTGFDPDGAATAPSCARASATARTSGCAS